MIDNLVENAIKYTSSGMLPEVELAVEAGEARILVTDHGVGVPEDERDRIFDRFYRATNVQGTSETGIGLGLYICRRIVEAHAGRIWVEPTPGGGSTFSVTIPVVAEAAATEARVADWQVPNAEPGPDGLEAAADA